MQKNTTNLVSKIDRAERIREERKRLGYTQQQIADICGVHRVQWGRYERGEQGLDGEPLNEFGKAGARVAYILTGQMISSNIKMVGKVKSQKDDYDTNETKLVSTYKKLSKKQQEAVLAMIASFVDE